MFTRMFKIKLQLSLYKLSLLSNYDRYRLAESIINTSSWANKLFFDLNSISFKSYEYGSQFIVADINVHAKISI